MPVPPQSAAAFTIAPEPKVLLTVKLVPSVPAPVQAAVAVPTIKILVLPPNDFVTVKFPFIDNVLPLSVTALPAALEEVNEPVTVKGSFKVIVVARFTVLAMITEVGHATPFDVIDAVFAVIIKFDDPVKLNAIAIVRVPELRDNAFARFKVPVVRVNVETEHVVPVEIIPEVLTIM